MKIIGEKINGTRKRVAEAILARDAATIGDLAIRQAEAGSTWIDVNAGTSPDREPDDLVWLVRTVQAATETPLAIDTANPQALRAAIEVVERTPLINSITGAAQSLGAILPIAAECHSPVIALAMDENRIAPTAEGRLEIIRRVVAETRRAGIADADVYIDPLAMTIATDTGAVLLALDAMRMVRSEFPDAHLSVGLSNVSFGMPSRSVLNRTFVALAIAAGLDAAILDPLDRDVMAAIVAAETLVGRDPRCRAYLRAARTGLFDHAPA